MACFLHQGKHHRVKKARWDLSTDTWGSADLRSRPLSWSGERENGSERGSEGLFPHWRSLDPWLHGGCFLLQILDRRGQVSSEVTNRLTVAVHPIGALWGGAPTESAGQGRSSPRGHREPGLPYPANWAVPQGPSSTQPPWSCVGTARLQAQLEKKYEETTI